VLGFLQLEALCEFLFDDQPGRHRIDGEAAPHRHAIWLLPRRQLHTNLQPRRAMHASWKHLGTWHVHYPGGRRQSMPGHVQLQDPHGHLPRYARKAGWHCSDCSDGSRWPGSSRFDNMPRCKRVGVALVSSSFVLLDRHVCRSLLDVQLLQGPPEAWR